MRILIVMILMLLLLGTLICYSALVAASRADEWEREEWEKRNEID